MVWREGKDHGTICYFCMTNLKGINRKNKHQVQYPDVPSAIKPVPHGPNPPVPEPDVTMESSYDPESGDTTDTAEFGANKPGRPVSQSLQTSLATTEVLCIRRQLMS